jgi:hypothetical protein
MRIFGVVNSIDPIMNTMEEATIWGVGVGVVVHMVIAVGGILIVEVNKIDLKIEQAGTLGVARAVSFIKATLFRTC